MNTANKICDAVAQKHNLAPADLRMRERGYGTRKVSAARAEAICQIRDQLGWSMPRIARAFDLADHTSVLWALRGGRRKSA